MRRSLSVLLVIVALTGCSLTNVSELVGQLAKDPAANCISVGTPYGTLMLARGTPQASVTLSGGNCTITGAGVTNVPVPIQVIPVPAKP